MGFEPTRAEHIGLAVQRLNHSATVSTDTFDIFSEQFPNVRTKNRKKFKIIKNFILEKNKKKGKIGFTGYKVNLVQLYNIDEDPTEKNDVSSEFPKVVNVMLTKLADYYVRLHILYHFMDELTKYSVRFPMFWSEIQ